MPRKRADDRKRQEYDLGGNVTVVVLYPDGSKPAMLHDDDAAIVSIDRVKFDEYANRTSRDAGVSIPAPQRAGRNRDLSPEARAEAMERLAIGDGGNAPEKPPPLSSEDVFRSSGVNPEILASITRAAEG